VSRVPCPVSCVPCPVSFCILHSLFCILSSVSVEVRDLHKHFGEGPLRVEVLRGITLSLDSHNPVAITGPSGCGKSTLLHCLGTLAPPSSGTIHIDGTNPFELPEPELARFRNSVIGFVFQDHHLLPQYSALENVLLPAMAFPDAASAPVERARKLLDRVGLSHRLDYVPAKLSGGERQRVAAARALVNQPSLLLCDEPTGNLDAETARSLADLLFELQREESTTLVVVTHSEQLASRFERRLDLTKGTCAEI